MFLVRALRNPERGFLDNALVTVIHDRASTIVGFIAPGLPKAHLRILTDGLFGFVFASVESWQATKRPKKSELDRHPHARDPHRLRRRGGGRARRLTRPH